MPATTEDIFELGMMTVALVALITITLVLSVNGMFHPVRPARMALSRFLVASRVVGRRTTSQECMLSVERDLMARNAMPIVLPNPNSRNQAAADDDAEEEPACPEPADYFSVHFGPVREGEQGATAASAGVVLEVAESATEAACSLWKKKLEKCPNITVELIACEGVGLQSTFPWRGPISRMIARYRVFRKYGLIIHREFRSRPQFSPCFVQVFSPEHRRVIVHAPFTPNLAKLREQHGLSLRPSIG